MSSASAASDWLRRGMRSFDATIALAVSWLTMSSMSHLDHTQGVEYPLLIVVGGLLLPACGELLGLYRPWRGRSLFTMLGVYAAGWLLTITIISLFLVVTHSATVYSRAWMGTTALGVLGVGALLRSVLYLVLRRIRSRGRNLKRVLVIGTPENIARIQQRLDHQPFLGYRITRSLDDHAGEGDTHFKSVEELVRRSIFSRDFDEVWLAYPLAQGERVKRLAGALQAMPVDVRYFPDLSDVRLLNHRVTQVADMFSLDLNRSPLGGPMRWVKAVEDRVLGALLLILFLPVMLVIAVLVRWQMGAPVLFKQYRHGLDGKRFRIYKFRTMAPHSPTPATRQAHPGDPRITPLGAFLRRTSLDELPQLYNVMQGRMSLVGPRPHAMDHNEFYLQEIDAYMQRHRVKPGMTGWAQVNGLRGITQDISIMRKRVEYDLYYIDNWSLAFDIKILFMTVSRGFINHQP